MDEIRAYYDQDREHDRLTRGLGVIEFARTMDVMLRVLPAAPASVLDIGGGTGVYARELLRLGYTVHLLDAMPSHVERVRADETLGGQASVRLGDARNLPYDHASADIVLVMGPLYHLQEAGDRAKVLREARRVLKPGGMLAAVVIPRTGAICGSLANGLADEDYARPLRERVYQTGIYLNPENRPGYFTSAYFHHPSEFEAELQAAGFEDVALYALEGPANLLADASNVLADPVRRRDYLRLYGSLNVIRH